MIKFPTLNCRKILIFFFKENIKNFLKKEFFQKKNDSLFFDHNAKKIIFSLEKSSGTLTDNYLNKNYYEEN
jgi:hypothetical protein